MAPLLLDLAVLYRALAFGADGDLDTAEVEAMRTALDAWAPGEDPASVEHALRAAALVDPRRPSIERVLIRVGQSLDADGRAQVLSDLHQVAQADGRVTRGEEDLILLVERVLGSAPTEQADT